ncbi:hypothetical protein FSPOR_7778 [Fusarium sporotrichioides]|uniref:Uncharacterized protein n=1 Tax=Fusarium sporotrichioides TaxID=5514 RepID=A0A395RX17_FUSSP|nr:hypothetical protein FSPOR_7778 [Fusarium sporotrichioides]
MEADDIPKWDFGQQPKGINPVPTDFIPFFSTTGDTRVDADKISLNFDLVAPTSRTRAAAWDRVPTLSTANGKNRQIMKRVPICNERKQSQPFVLLPQVNFLIPNTRESIALDELLPRKVRRGSKYEPVSREVAYSGNVMSHAFMVNGLIMATTNVANNFMYTSSCTSYEDRRDARNGICQITPLKRRADALNNDADIPIMLARTGGNKLGFYYKVLPMIKRAYSRGKKEVDVATASMVEFSSYLRRTRRNPRQHIAAFGVPDLSDIADESEPESPTVVREPVLKFESRSPAKRIARLANPFSKSTSRGNRLAQGFVKLVPGLARGGFSTPVKSRPSPVPQTASPVYDYAVASLQYSPSASDDEAEAEASPSKEGSPEPAQELSSPTRSPGRTFRVPSEFDSSSIAGDESIQGPPSTPNKSSPVNYSRPVGPTPSRWNRPEPTTPFTPVPQSATAATPGETDSPIGLYAMLAPDTPKAPACTYETLSGTDSIDFGGASAFESSLSWMNTSAQASEQARSQNVNQARRRRSEPLLLKSVLTQARRRSASPQKLRFKSDDTFHDVISIASLFDLPVSADTTVETVAEDNSMSETAPVDAAPAEPTTIQTTHTELPTADTAPSETTTTETVAEAVPTDSAKDVRMNDSDPSDDGAVSEILPIEVDDSNHTDDAVNHDAAMEDSAPIATTDDNNVATMDSLDALDGTIARDVTMEDPAPIVTTDNDNIAGTIDHPTVHDQSAANEQSIVQIDVRENPDIFGAHPSSPPAPIETLSRMADDACDGHAKVVVTEENGRLFVRFKLSAEYAHMFPPSQGFGDNDLAFSPSALTSTPKIKSESQQLASTAQLNLTPLPSNEQLLAADVSRDFTFSSLFAASSPADMATPTDRSIGHLLDTPTVTGRGITNDASSPGFQTPELPAYHDNTLVFGEPTAAAATPQPMSTKRVTRRQSAMTPLKRATTNAMEAANRTPAPASKPNYSTPKFASPAFTNDDTTVIFPWSDVEDSPSSKRRAQPAPTPAAIDTDTTLVISGPDTPAELTTRTDFAPAEDEQLISDATAPVQDELTTTHSAAAVDNDSPNREFMRNFIKRTRQPTAAESGSPIPPAAARKPLGDRSPNRGTSSMSKRKHEDEDEDENPSPKKVKVEGTPLGKKPKAARKKSNLDIDMVDFPATQDTGLPAPNPAGAANDRAASPPTTRRSSRLRGQDNGGGPKSSLPTPIKLTRAGAGRGSLARKPRSEEQELDRKTRSNTKKNMGDAESPAEVLTRIRDQAEEDSDVGEGSAGGRRVGWKDPLEKIQGSSPKKRAEPKGKATQGKTRVTKPKATRAAKVAEGPKSPRVTRSRARGGA